MTRDKSTRDDVTEMRTRDAVAEIRTCDTVTEKPSRDEGTANVVKHLTADPGISSSTPLTPTKRTERRYVLALPRINVPVYQCYTLGTLKNLVRHADGRSMGHK